MRTFGGLAFLMTAGTARAQGNAPLSDSLFQRAQRLVRDGDRTRAGALLDSLVRVTRDGTDARAQALMWRATLSADSAVAENDLVAIVVDHALSPVAADALLRLGQIEDARGARQAAILHFERLVLEHRASAAAPEGWYWLGLARLRNNEAANGCVALDSAKRRIPSSNVELLNRLNFVAQPCRALAEAREAPPSPPANAPDTVAAVKAPARRWSAQVGAFNTNAEAERVVQTMKTKGHTARVDKIPPRFHVRIGSFATRAEAVALVSKLKRENITAIVVEAAPREP
jgi:hypothetical protein